MEKRIKTVQDKALLALMILTLAMFSCGFGAEEAAIEYDELGRRLVTLSVNTGNSSRSMSLDIAQTAINYYEVVFKDSNKYYRAAGLRGRTLTLNLPEGLDVTGTENAILFAGYWDRNAGDKLLLATGKVTAVNGTGSGFTVRNDTTAITFTLEAITTTYEDQATASLQAQASP